MQDRSTGELKFGQRWYSPDTGSWTQQDALNAPLDPNNANRYEYAADNPLNIFDPVGTDVFGTVFAGLGLVAAGIALFTLGPEVGIVAGVAAAVGFGLTAGGFTYETGSLFAE